jgi:MerR family transcriptional regulator, light-induced transcriptional regulator
MSNYSIKDLEKYTGVKAHTIRIWEQRYNLLKPRRTETNIRYYDDEQLRFLLNVSMLVSHDYKISKISKLTKEEVQNEVKKIYNKSNEDDVDTAIQFKMNNLVMSMMDLDELRFDKIFSTSVIKRGFERTMIEVMCPFLTKVGIMSRTGEINNAHEHFIYQMIRQKVMVAIDGLPLFPQGKDSYLLYLPDVKHRDLFILNSYYFIKARGKHVVFLGQNISVEELKSVVEIKNPDNIMTFISSPACINETKQYFKTLSKVFPRKHILFSGTQSFLKDVPLPGNTTYLPTLTSVIEEIEYIQGEE